MHHLKVLVHVFTPLLHHLSYTAEMIRLTLTHPVFDKLS